MIIKVCFYFCNLIFGLIFNLMFWGCNCYKNHHDSSIPHIWWWRFSMMPRSNCGFQTMLTPMSMISRLWKGTAFGTSPPPTPSAATTAALQRGPSCKHLVLSLITFSSRILLQSCGEVGWIMLFLVAVDMHSLDQLAFFRLMYSTLLNLSNWCGEGARVSNCTLACPPYNHIVLLVLSMFILSSSD